MKYGKKLPQIYDTSGREDGYYITGTSYYGTGKTRFPLSLYGDVQLPPGAQLHITIKRPVFQENPGKIWRIIVLCLEDEENHNFFNNS